MTEDSGLQAAQNLVFQKIGRNLINFQKMERMLKFILKVGNLSKPKPMSALAAHFQHQESLLRTRPMGDLIERTFDALRSTPEDSPPDITEPWVSVSVGIEGENWGPKQWRREMRRVLKERNVLVHHITEQFDISTVAGCSSLCIELDAQRERALPAFDQLRSLVQAITMHGQVLAQNIDAIAEASMQQRSPHDA